MGRPNQAIPTISFVVFKMGKKKDFHARATSQLNEKSVTE